MSDQAAPPSPPLKFNFGKLPLVEKILCAIAILVLVGWVMRWTDKGWKDLGLFTQWSASLSVLGALALATIIILKVFGIRPLPERVEKHIIPIASLVPLAGHVVEVFSTVHQFLIVGGSLALAYLSTTTYWRKHIPEFATKPLGEGAALPREAPVPSPEPVVTSESK